MVGVVDAPHFGQRIDPALDSFRCSGIVHHTRIEDTREAVALRDQVLDLSLKSFRDARMPCLPE
jgi:hypothetical protein